MSLPPVTVKVKTRKLNVISHQDEISEDYVAVETPIEIVLNGTVVATLLATPSQIEELATGFLLDEGLVKSSSDFIKVMPLGKTVNVEVKGDRIETETLRNFGLVLTSCGSKYLDSQKRLQWPRVSSEYRTKAQEISQMIIELSRSSLDFARTGAMHSAAIFYDNKMKAFAEDVGRHNAIDKVIGSSAKQELDLGRAVLVTTGRQPADLVLKPARVGIPITVSMRGPIHSGIAAAENVGVTLVCFARGPRMNVYTYPERILA